MIYSLVIPAHHRPDSLERLLSSIVRETEDWKQEDFEVIVVVDGEDVAVSKEAKARLGHLPILVLQNKEPRGAAGARNQGAAFAHGDILVFLDDDVELAQGWGNILPEAGTDFDFVSGDVYFGNPDRPGTYPERVVRSTGGGWPLGAHFFVRRELFLAQGGFDESYGALHNEDSEFVLRLLQAGISWKKVPHLAVHHEIRWWSSARQLFESTKHIAVLPRLIKTYPKAMRYFPLKRWGPILYPETFFLTLLLPITIFPLLARFCVKNRKHLWKALPFFFAKWPCAVILYRYHLWKSAWKEGIFVI